MRNHVEKPSPSLAQRLSTMVFGEEDGSSGDGTAAVAQGAGAMSGRLLLATGSLSVIVHSAEGVHNVQHDDFFTVTEQEPYVFVHLKGVGGSSVGSTARTERAVETGTQGREPKWDDPVLKVPVTPKVQTVSVELWNHNIVKDDHIGSFEAPLLEQLLYLNQRAWYHLDTGGMIELTFSHVPAGAPATGEVRVAPREAVAQPSTAAGDRREEEGGGGGGEDHSGVKTIRNSLAHLSLLITTTKPPPGPPGKEEEGDFTPPGSPQPRYRMKDKQRRAFEASPEFKHQRASRDASRDGSASGSPRRHSDSIAGADGGAAAVAETSGVLASVQSILAGVHSTAKAAVADFSTGFLIVEAHGASGLQHTQMFGSMDPYAVAKLESAAAEGAADDEDPPVLSEARTMYAFRGGVEPEWDKRLDSRMELTLMPDTAAVLVDVSAARSPRCSLFLVRPASLLEPCSTCPSEPTPPCDLSRPVCSTGVQSQSRQGRLAGSAEIAPDRCGQGGDGTRQTCHLRSAATRRSRPDHHTLG
jgi:hypothetical protein